jgi:very-short-patch-repair endonuclease
LKPSSLTTLEDRYALLDLYERCGANYIIESLGVSKKTVYDYLNLHGVEFDSGRSGHEKEIENFINDLGFDTRNSVRDLISPYEIDIYIPSKNIAIEFNGIFWHSSRFKDKDYHQKKSLLCKENGFQLIHIWEDDWINNSDVIKKKIVAKLGLSDRIYARNTSVCIPIVKEVRELYETNHIQGFVSATAHVGLRDISGKLVACASFREKESSVWDLVRFAGDASVVGGFSKIMKYFKENFEWSEIFTYAHLDYSYGNLYEKTGFEKSHITQPGLWYTDFKKRYRREKFMKHKLSAILDNFDEDLTEKENMLNHGFYQIFDAGSIKYIMYNT